MRVTMKLTAKERRAGLDLRDVLGPNKAPRRKKPAVKTGEFRPIEYTETRLHDTAQDKVDETGGVKLYCTAGAYTHGEENARWALQVFARVRTKTRGVGKHFAIGTAQMSIEDLRWLRDQINIELRRK